MRIPDMPPLPSTVKLSSGALMPSVGLGTWKAEPGEVGKAVTTALKNGYKHIDAAAIYGNETEVGRGIKESGVKREDIWITSKLWNDKHNPKNVRPALEKTLKDLGVSYLDLYLIHWPLAFKPNPDSSMGFKGDDGKVVLEEGVTLEDTWKAMEALVDAGLTKHIGLSNFTIENIKRVQKIAKKNSISVLQVELHPYLPQDELIDFCKKEGIVVTAYSPLGSGSDLIKDKTVAEIAEKTKQNAGQVLISWAVQRGTVAIPKSTNPDRIKSNITLKPIEADDLATINKLAKKDGRVVSSKGMWGIDVFA